MKQEEIENPFTDSPLSTTTQKYFMLSFPLWQWDKTENIQTGEMFYDSSNDGRLFSARTSCPVCDSEDSVVASAGLFYDNIVVRDITCLACGKELIEEGVFGEADLIPRDEQDDDYRPLPLHVIVSVLIENT